MKLPQTRFCAEIRSVIERFGLLLKKIRVSLPRNCVKRRELFSMVPTMVDKFHVLGDEL
jgi:hypothetical protein